MNKWQVICPLAAIALLAIFVAIISGSTHRRYYIQAQTQMIGQELIARTNSARLAGVSPALQERLARLLAAPASVEAAILDDETSPIGDGRACSRLVLSNAAGWRLGIRLRQDLEPERFHVLAFWTITEPSAHANRPKHPARP